MFENLTSRFTHIIKNLSGQGRLTESNIADTLREVRIALLEADVSLPIVKGFIERVRTPLLGQEVMQSLTPGQMAIKIVYDELVKTMGEQCEELNLATTPPAIILIAGLQGSGKTTTVAKLAFWLNDLKKKSVCVTSTDIYRPAAIQQLQHLAQTIGIDFYFPEGNPSPTEIVDFAVKQAKLNFKEVLIVDTAGRLHIDEGMMSEVKTLHQHLQPIETLFVVDSMTGQDAVNTAAAFNDTLPLTGVILTKADGDARGGAALSIRETIHKPIKFIGVGEKVHALEPFYPDRIASRILGMGDVLTLIEEAHRKVDKVESEKLAKKFMKGKDFDLEDFRTQLQQMKNMGGMTSLLDKLPGMSALPGNVKEQLNDKTFTQIEAIINSMTPQERRFPDIIRGSRKRRISLGSGTQVQDINRLLKQFDGMKKMMKRFNKGGGLLKMMQKFGGST